MRSERDRERERAYYQANKDEILAKQRTYRASFSPERIEARKAYQRSWTETHKEARLAYAKRYRETHPDQVLAGQQRRRLANPDYFRRKSREWSAAHPEYGSRKAKENLAALRAEAIAAYGGRCICCGETIIAFLTIDHTNGDGKRHRASVGHSSKAVYRDLQRRGWPKDGFRLLCMNCNVATYRLKVCPHQENLTSR